MRQPRSLAKTSDSGASASYGEVSEHAYSAEIPFDKNNPATWLCAAQNGGIGEDQAEKLEVGMTFTEVVALLGRPQRDVGSGSMLAEWDMQSGKVLTVCFRPSGTDADATISYRILIRG
ncbi:MAG: outer membrane protein assembly factor BamE [Oscillospiraceae bacterium]|nr:MAG: outer membrane protein assembly factor BamE [Oscillospiraceae bacterium]